MTKADIRRQLRDLPPLSPGEAERRNSVICDKIRAHPAWGKAQVVAIYFGSRHEPSLESLWLNDAGRVFGFPRVDGTGIDQERLTFHRARTAEDLLPSRWGLREPASNPETEILPENFDLVLVPGVAFSADGARLGRGRGHYDRFVPRLRRDAVVLGVCFSERLLPNLPLETHDHPMNAVISA